MIIAGQFSFKGGNDAVATRYPQLLAEIRESIAAVDASIYRTKASKEKTMPGKLLYAPKQLNRAFKDILHPRGWHTHRVPCEYPTQYYAKGYQPKTLKSGAFREMDFVKETLGVEVQFGKYAFMAYNVCAKMTIFKNLGFIDCGVEIVPVKAFSEEMSSGISYFEQFVWDLETRGTADIDIPVLILGVDA